MTKCNMKRIIQHQATPAQIALVWLMAQKPWMAPIQGTTKTTRLPENIGGANILLKDDDLVNIRTALNSISLLGERYPPGNAGEKSTINKYR